ncbi:MAG: hypothetical protein Kow00117_16810 [Phototrophicales bacterium]
MSRKDRLANVDPFGNEDDQSTSPVDLTAGERPRMTMADADQALFGALAKREGMRQTIRPISIFNIQPDVKQPRRAVPYQVREHWSGRPKDIADLFNAWVMLIDQERQEDGHPPFNLDEVLWSEAVERQGRSEDDIENAPYQAGPIENSFLKVIHLAISIRRDGLANPITVQRTPKGAYRIETGERRWLAYHVLFGYFNGDAGKPNERDKWENIPCIVVEDFNVWRQASENAARADLNAIGRARQFALLLMDLLAERGVTFQDYETLVHGANSDRAYYAQVVPYRVPSGKSEMLLNGLGVAHRAAFTRCRALLELPDEVWMIGDVLDLSEDELLRLAKINPPQRAVEEARRIAKNVATRNNLPETEEKSSPRKEASSPTLFTDKALKRGKRLFTKQHGQIAKELFEIRDGVGQASVATKRQIRDHIQILRACLDQLESALDQ